MDDKKNPGRFSIKFSTADPTHQAVINLLNRQSPRGKAQFIANAILHYVHCPETPDFKQPMADSTVLERMVLEILEKQNFTAATKLAETIVHGSAPPQVFSLPLPGSPDNPATPETKVDATSLAAISGTLAAFRKQ